MPRDSAGNGLAGFSGPHISHQQTLNRNNSSTFHQIQKGVHFAS